LGNKKERETLDYLKTRLSGQYLVDEPLALHTWYKLGGPADFFVYPRNLEDLRSLLHFCRTVDMCTYFIGEGANILSSDAGFRGVIIKLSRHFNSLQLEDDMLKADAGTHLEDLILFCEKNNLGGLECLSGIPGTVGGALIMNAGTGKGEIGDRVQGVYVLDEALEPSEMSSKEISFEYRSVPQLNAKVILGCKLKLHSEKESVLKAFRLHQLEERAAKQPLEYPSCGSVFKRPARHYVGKMVEEAGLKGFRYGDAMISDKHGGFIVNTGHAKASDIVYLIRKVQEKILDKFGVELEPEVKFLGF